jgi:hypothetical protein
MELINLIPKTVILWEPMHRRQIYPFNIRNFPVRHYVPEDVVWDEGKRMFEHMLSGKFLNDWTCSQSFPLSYLMADRMIVKFCRAHALLPWLTRNFQFNYAPIFLVRRPFAVVASQLNYGGPDWG